MMDARHSIAIVDDEEHVRVALRRLCSAYGMNPRTYASARQLLDSLDSHDSDLPHCLILDVQMPGLGGLDAQAAIRARGIQIPAIVITGRDDHEMRARSVALGVHAYLCKPIDAEILVGAITGAIDAAGPASAPSELPRGASTR